MSHQHPSHHVLAHGDQNAYGNLHVTQTLKLWYTKTQEYTNTHVSKFRSLIEEESFQTKIYHYLKKNDQYVQFQGF
jgi:hypothetical protein